MTLDWLQRPLVLQSVTDRWPCHDWTLETLASLCGEKKFNCRVALRSCDLKMETECCHHSVTLKQFCDWLKEVPDEENPLNIFSPTQYSCYIDYNYMKDVFAQQPHIFKDVMWKDFGLNDFDGYDSTIWIGSGGAYTPGHQDSYGFNLVSQIIGRKLWVLFPPDNSRYLYPSRVPYEESSIFMRLNVMKPDLEKHPSCMHSQPIVVTLCPGQSLYVPHHWWHFVESLEPSVSINVWVPLEADKESRVKEAITRTLASCLIETLDLTLHGRLGQEKWLNPSETLASSETNLLLLQTALVQADKASFEDNTPLSQQESEVSSEICGIKMSETKSSKYTESLKVQNLQDGGGACNESVSERYLHSFAEAIRKFKITKVASPFLHASDLLSHPTHESELQADQPAKRRKVEEKTCISHLSDFHGAQIFSLTPCTFNSYLDFMNSLCAQRNCQTCGVREIKTKYEYSKLRDDSCRRLYDPEAMPLQKKSKSQDSHISFASCDGNIQECSTSTCAFSDGNIQECSTSTCASSDGNIQECSTSTCASGVSSGCCAGFHGDASDVTPPYERQEPQSVNYDCSVKSVLHRSEYLGVSRTSSHGQLTQLAEALLSSVLHPDIIQQVKSHLLDTYKNESTPG